MSASSSETVSSALDLSRLRAELSTHDDARIDAILALITAAYRRAAEAGTDGELDHAAVAARFGDAVRFMDDRPAGELRIRAFTPDDDASVVQVNVEDSPFLVTTAVGELARLGHHASAILHPVVGVERTADRLVHAIGPARPAQNRESFIDIRLEQRLTDAELAHVEKQLEVTLTDARAATRDVTAMREQLINVILRMRRSAAARYDEEEIDEVADLLTWLLRDNFVFLGYREYALTETDHGRAAQVVSGSGLGILADEQRSTYAKPVLLTDVEPDLRERMVSGELLTVSRTNRRSTVHRQSRMEYLGVKTLGPNGEIVGEQRFLGLFARSAYAEPSSTIPVLRRKLVQVLDAEDIVADSHDERTLRALFDAFPKHELFGASIDELRDLLIPLLHTQERHEVRLLCRADPNGRGLSALVSIPRERFSSTIRENIQAFLAERFGTDAIDYHLSMTDGGQALLHFLLHVDDASVEDISYDELEREVVALARTWDDALRDALVAAFGDDGAVLADRWQGRFPAPYQAVVDPRDAVADVWELTGLVDEDESMHMALQRASNPATGPFRLKFYKTGQGVELSSFLPILESLGFVVVEEVPYTLDAIGSDGLTKAVHVHDFGVRVDPEISEATDRTDGLDIDADGERLAAAAQAIWRGRAEADSLNRLVLLAGLRWYDVVLLRAYRRYRRQVGTSFTEAYQNAALLAHPDVARALVELFAARFDPDLDAGPEVEAAARARVDEGLDAVERLDYDRILRRYLGAIDATVRTNRYIVRRGGRGSSALAFKLDSRLVPEVPKPVPHSETFVYSPELEGVHLRGGPVARGGIRWSSRLEDVRTEVLGLMKAQMVKNAVIVPTGAKGGFVLKRPPADPAELRAEVHEQYQVYIRALLDVADNVVKGEVVAPPRVRRRDGDDPYLVVAADRGTATFSDTANSISIDYGFWLGDAFASGGSRGYDHKGMGITARGAWVAVQRHFRELGVDVQTEPTRVVGIGDMSGDVFGNGLLRSKAVKLVAAFDHRDIFIDPDPDPVTSYAERQRLFSLAGSSWADYDRSLISAGGGVWSRSVKEIVLSEEVQALLQLEVARISPPDLIKALLRAPVDLLFAGGVGTFVKASSESAIDVGDRANDSIRIDASELGARVVGEGGNLALTQRARIQYARRGGRCNTDAIDNSAGVDTSDREVNLKILFQTAADQGLLTAAERDALLRDMTDDVAEAVLADVYLQSWAISQELSSSAVGLEAYEQLMTDLETAVPAQRGSDQRTRAGSFRLDREVELLPSTEEMHQRMDAGAGLTRPELAVLLGYSKVDLRTRLLGSRVPDLPELRETLVRYFPPEAVQRFGALLDEHRLRRELVATMLANEIVNRMGITYVSRTAHEFGCMAFEVAAAYWAARAVVGADALWADIEALDERCDPALQTELKSRVDGLVDAFVRTYLREGGIEIAGRVRRDEPAFTELARDIAGLGSPARHADRQRRAGRYVDLGIPEELAERIATMTDLAMVPDVAVLSQQLGQPVGHVAAVFFEIDEALPMEYLYRRLRAIDAVDQWERWQHRGLHDELRWARRTAATRVLKERPDHPVEEAVAGFLGARIAGQERIHGMIDLIQREETPTLPAIAVAIRVLRDVLSSEPAPA
jgi:glutamate dehydrogenase